MRYKIYENGTLINTIVADESFVNTYCADNGYTYQEAPLPEPPEPEPEPTEAEVLQAQVAELQAELLRLRTGG